MSFVSLRTFLFCAIASPFLFALPASAAEQVFRASLDPVPFNGATKANVRGVGTITARLDGNTLTIAGTFSDLSSAATSARVFKALAMAVPGDTAIGDLVIDQEMQGKISGKVTLTRALVENLRRGQISVRLYSAKAPDGNLEGWLEAGTGSDAR